MKRSDKTKLALSLLALAPITGVIQAQSGKTDLGKQAYEENCAGCHGDVDDEPEAFVRARILMLIEYLSRLQER